MLVLQGIQLTENDRSCFYLMAVLFLGLVNNIVMCCYNIMEDDYVARSMATAFATWIGYSSNRPINVSCDSSSFFEK